MTKIYGYGVREKLANYASALEGCGAECVFSLDVEEALDALGQLTGRTAREEIVSGIFSRFCVGK